MGLDNYAARSEDEPLSEEESQSFAHITCLVKGMMAGSYHCLRGKCYYGIIEQLTGVDIYTDYLDSDEVDILYERLRLVPLEEVLTIDPDFTPTEWDNLVEYFRVIAVNGWGLVGWY